MQIYLLKDLPGKGKAGEIINVNDGYGKNFLIKNKIGTAVDAAVLSRVRAKADSDAFKMAEEKAAIGEIIKKLEGATITLTAKVGEGGKMFGSVTATEISKALEDQGISIEKRNIVLGEPIKNVGEYKIKVKFSYGLEGNFLLKVMG